MVFMLIDVSRRPVRLIFEECPTIIVVRSMRVTGQADGLLHQDISSMNVSRSPARTNTLAPKVALHQKGYEYIETILPGSEQPQELGYLESEVARTREAIRRGEVRIAPPRPRVALSNEPYYVISGHQDQFAKQLGVWRINFVSGAGPKSQRLLTLLDETHGTVLFTCQVPPVSTTDGIFKINTPLERYIRRPDAAPGLWKMLREEGDDEVD
jgi:hypothetical protein